MNDMDFKFFEDLLKKESGLSITPEKIYLLESRLLPVATKFSMKGLNEIVSKLRLNNDADLKKAVVEAMTTNETSFFRDTSPFEKFTKEILPYFLKARSDYKGIRIWSAACSSGQEPYSLAMLLKEYGPALDGWRIEIMATDLSDDILEQARAGIYTQFEVQRGLPIQMLVKYFDQKGDKWQVKPEIRSMVSFKPINLLDNLSTMGSFDIVFCRNVLIYFDLATKDLVLKSIKNILKPDGFLFLGGAETVLGVTDAFKVYPEIRGVYVRGDTTIGKTAAQAQTGTSSK